MLNNHSCNQGIEAVAIVVSGQLQLSIFSSCNWNRFIGPSCNRFKDPSCNYGGSEAVAVTHGIWPIAIEYIP